MHLIRLSCFALLLAPVLGGCSSDSFWDKAPFFTSSSKLDPNAPPRQPPPVPMAGRWILQTADGQCAMTFAEMPEAAEGTIAPEGGCPGKFYSSRNWLFDKNQLLIRDQNGDVLARLSLAGDARFGGTTAAGDQAVLAR
jgi:hypothetical protein